MNENREEKKKPFKSNNCVTIIFFNLSKDRLSYIRLSFEYYYPWLAN